MLALAITIGVQLHRAGWQRAGIGVFVAFDCLLRVSELCNLKREDVADTGDRRISTSHKGMILRLGKTKTGGNKEVTVNDTHAQHLLRLLVQHTKPKQPLFPYTTAYFRKLFKATVTDLGLSDLYIPHSLRHGGATYYRHVLKWTIEDVMERGRWAASKSARRYIQSGRAMLMEMDAPQSLLQLAVKLALDPSLYLTFPNVREIRFAKSVLNSMQPEEI